MLMEAGKSDMVFRTMGTRDSFERIGCGFMNKSGIKEDQINSVRPHYSFVYILGGRGVFIDDSGHSYPLARGYAFHRFPNMNHSNIIDPESNWYEFFIDFGPKLFEAFCTMNILNNKIPVLNIGCSEGNFKKCLNLLSFFRNTKESEKALLLAKLISTLIELLHESRQNFFHAFGDSLIDEACLYLGSSFKLNRGLKSFCQERAVGYEHFRKAFKESVGISPVKYRIKRRIDYALVLLKKTNLSVKEISYKLNYNSPYEFSWQFKKYTGLSPSQMRYNINKKV